MWRGAWGLVLVASTAIAATPSTIPPDNRPPSPPSPPSSVTPSEIQAAMQAQRPAFVACHEKAVANQPDLFGKFVYKFTISANGSVTKAEPTKPTKESKRLDACVIKAIKRVKFPARSMVAVAYPLVFAKP